MYGIGGELDEQVGETWRWRENEEGERVDGFWVCVGDGGWRAGRLSKPVFSHTCQLFINLSVAYHNFFNFFSFISYIPHSFLVNKN